MINKIRSYHISALLFLAALAGACSTTKNTFVTRTYHNTTARYNGYFYAKESMKDAQDKIDRTWIDDYSQLLPLFRIPTTPETKGCYTDLEKAIKKSTMVIERHAITTRSGDEIAGAVKWIDENYLIIGQAHYYKQEYIPALEIFDYVVRKYPKDPSQNIAIMWKARCQIQLGNYTEAESLLDVVANDKTTPAKMQGDIKITYADLYIHTGNYPNAIKYLEEAIPLTKKKKVKARYSFVLGQLYELTGDNKKAGKCYTDVVALNPPYEMLFNAKLNQARLGGGSAKTRTAAKKDLEKMLADEKNKEYQDQIYYTLAQLEQSGGNKEGAINFYRKSVAASMGNNKQKALSYLALGDLYFTDKIYKTAGLYYDSTMMFLPKDYKGYNSISDKKQSLSALVKYSNIISKEDSLQNVVKTYGKDTTTLYPYIDKLIAKAKADEEKKKKELEEKMAQGGGDGPMMNNQNNQNNQNQSAALWYFYNPSTIGFGINEFNRKWGNRKLEDNWRRANKESLTPEEIENEGGKDTSKVASGKANSAFTREFYMKDLPLTDELMKKSDELVADALYNLGGIYKDQLQDMTKASETYEALCARYPQHKFALQSHFQLYRIYQKTGNKSKEQEHADYICKNHPKSEYCSLISNPNYEVNLMAEKQKVSAYYDSTYMEYTRRKYALVITRCNYADSSFGTKNDHAAKFAYLRALSLGKVQGVPAMESALVRLIDNYPKDPMKAQAQQMLDFIRKTGTSSVGKDTSAKVPSGVTYSTNPGGEHQYMVVAQNGKGDINKFRIALSDFNSENYGSLKLSISTVVLDGQRQAVLVKSFGDQSSAMNYYNNLRTHPEIFAWLNAGTFNVSVISTENFGTMLKNKDADGYRKFFDEKILKKTP